MTRLRVILEFLEPFRLMENDDRRGATFARWVTTSNGQGRPEITGTLLRSAMIRGAEELLTLTGGQWNGIQCCPGEFFVSEAKNGKPTFYRQRPTLRWDTGYKTLCVPDNPCPLCLLLGRHDAAGKKAQKREASFHVHFGNLYPTHGAGLVLEAIGQKRILNRVDFPSGKAHDFFEVWEIDGVKEFQGKITLAEIIGNSNHYPAGEAVPSLLQASLAMVNQLCGAACRISLSNITTALSTDPEAEKDANSGPNVNEILNRMAKEIEESPEMAGRLRVLADALRELRSSLRVAKAGDLPRGKKLEEARYDREGNEIEPAKYDEHILWDLKTAKGQKLRDLLAAAGEILGNQRAWRRFCEKLGQAVYQKAQEAEHRPAPVRPLGEKAFSHCSEADRDTGRVPCGYIFEWIILGRLEAQTPFYFGTRAEAGRQTSLTLVLDRNGRYRLPRSVLRGCLRRDLNLASDGEGCLAELGPKRPCPCPVCQIMRQVRLRDNSLENVEIPPPIRQRLRRNPWTDIVDEGALFDQEVGPEGLTFPFVLRYRGRGNLPSELRTVLSWWQSGRFFLGGAGGTGKGRFQLKDVQVWCWDLTGGINDYIENLGYRGKENEIPTFSSLPPGLQNYKVLGPDWAVPYPWELVCWQLHFEGPVLVNHPLRALLSGEADAVFHRKVKIIPSAANGWELVPMIKGETARGLVRAALGRAMGKLADEHQDCTCILCRIFGNEYRSGKVRFEDLTPVGEPPAKRLDHVAIDRFTGGAGWQLKFDDQPLYGTPRKPLVFQGVFWVHRDLGREEKEALTNALADLKAGLATVGTKGGIGYGWIKKLEIAEGPDWLKETLQPGKPASPSPQEEETSAKPPSIFGALPPLDLKPEVEAVYYPHYFLPLPESGPKRVLQPITHSLYYRNTGWLTCTLTTLTPLIIPDTSRDRTLLGSEGLNLPPGHKSFRFFRLGEEIMIPGAELRGMVSSVYEALTNSCLRIFGQKNRLSWRMPAAEAPEFRPGRVEETPGGQIKYSIRLMDLAKIPLYDDSSIEGQFQSLSRTCKRTLDFASPNRKFLSEAANDIFYGRQRTPFYFLPGYWLVCGDNLTNYPKLKQKYGYIKFTGPNKVEVERVNAPPVTQLPSPPDDWKSILNQNVDSNVNVPYYQAYQDGIIYTVKKRRERFFMEKKNARLYPIPPATVKRYEQTLREYRWFAQRGEVPEVFRSILPDHLHANGEKGKLQAGDLVYFRVANWGNDKSEVLDIIPVSISRIVDERLIGLRLKEPFRPCAHVCLEDCEPCTAQTGSCAFYREGAPARGLCPACHLFGTQGYRGRVRFGFATLQSEPQFCTNPNGDHAITLPLLEQPRPTWSMIREFFNREGTVESRIPQEVPGRKFYVHHQGWKKVLNGTNPATGEPIKPDEKNRTVEALAAGSTFTFRVFFQNLEDWELGLLLYSLELEPGLAHKLGMGKPLGFGSVQVQVQEIHLRKNPGEWEAATTRKQGFIETGLEMLRELWGSGAKQALSALGQLLRYQEEPQVSVRYPRLKQEAGEAQPGYVELKKARISEGKVSEVLKTPWQPWWP